MKSLLFKLSSAALLTVALVGCGIPDDDAKLSEIEENEQVTLCEDVCADAVSYDLTCMVDGAEITSSSKLGDDEAACNTGCTAQLAAVKDACALTVGDIRDFYTVAPTCDTTDAQLEKALDLVECTAP